MFEIGDFATATKNIWRVDGRSSVRKGDHVKITSVYKGKEYTIVSIIPCNGSLPMIDICCNTKGPLKRDNP